jgi:hypothetical protein
MRMSHWFREIGFHMDGWMDGWWMDLMNSLAVPDMAMNEMISNHYRVSPDA